MLTHVPTQYVPVMGDMVVGVVLEKFLDSARVELGSAVPAILPVLAFEGATRKNRPNIQVPLLFISALL